MTPDLPPHRNKQPEQFLHEAEGLLKTFQRSIAADKGAIVDLAQSAKLRQEKQLAEVARRYPQHAGHIERLLSQYEAPKEAE